MAANSIMTEQDFKKEVKEAIISGKRKLISLGQGLYCTVLPSKRCTFSVRSVTNKTDKRVSIGYYPEMELPEARAKAIELLGPYNVLKNNSNASFTSPLFGDYADVWKETKKANPNAENSHKNNKWYRNVCSSLNVLIPLRQYHLEEITPTLVDKVLSAQTDRSQYSKFHAIQILNQCLNSAEVEGIIEKNHCRNMLHSTSPISIKYRRPKVKGFNWTKPELLKTEFFEKLETTGRVKHKYFWLLITFTAVRDGALSMCKWNWIDFDKKLIHIPGKYMKKGRPFDVPITIFTKAILINWKKYCEENGCLGEYVFTAEKSLSSPMRLNDLQTYISQTTETTMHGIRKSCSTWLAAMGVPYTVREEVLSHRDNAQSAVAATYNKYEYFLEKFDALRLWGYFIYEYQLPISFKKMLKGINTNHLKAYKENYEKRNNKIQDAWNKLY